MFNLYVLCYIVTSSMGFVPPWRDTRIHILGNHGFMGRVHAVLAMPITRLIDKVAYNGKDVRSLLKISGPDTVDFGCGIGMSTPIGAYGVDSSKEMIHVGKVVHPSIRFRRGLAERWGDNNMVSVAICSFLLHEQPANRRKKILRNAYRVCRDYMLIMDIDPVYNPSEHMLSGEPYIADYLENIDLDIHHLFDIYTRTEIIPGHVVLWNISKHVE